MLPFETNGGDQLREVARDLVAKHAEAVYVLHCFRKTTPKTAQTDIDLAAKRYKLIGA